jgi:hypothetical protein
MLLVCEIENIDEIQLAYWNLLTSSDSPSLRVLGGNRNTSYLGTHYTTDLLLKK